tara:strand:- start:438 stop:3788 length:3351 start_codon:yes stop_codon:yes gene_type:complete
VIFIVIILFSSITPIFINGPRDKLDDKHEGFQTIATPTPSGNPEWMTAIMSAGPLTIQVSDMVSDSNGNMYVGGYFSGDISINGTTLTSSGDEDVVVAKFDSEYNLVWAVSGGGPNQDRAMAIILDSNGFVLVTGTYSTGPVIFGNDTNAGGLQGGASGGGFTSKISSNGMWLWTSLFDWTVAPKDIALDSNNNVYVTGSFNQDRVFVWKISTDGSYEIQWKSPLNQDWITGTNIAIDNQGDILLAGLFYGTVTLCSGNSGCPTITSDGDADVFVAKLYDTGGFDAGIDWAISGGGPNSENTNSLVVDSTGNAYLSGQFIGDSSFGLSNVSALGTASDGYVVKILSNGSWDWAEQSYGPSAFDNFDLEIDENDNLIVIGSMWNLGSNPQGTVSYGNFSFQVGNMIFVLGLDNTGYWNWSFSGGLSSDQYLLGSHYIGNELRFAAGVMNPPSWWQFGTANGSYSLGGQASVYLNTSTTVYMASIIHSEDLDGDGLENFYDHCPDGVMDWASTESSDLDMDGCRDAGSENWGLGEDVDDDGDGIWDSSDICPLNYLNWFSDSTTDHDSDGCHDTLEDVDDDNDGFSDGADSCPQGTIGTGMDYDSDGCQADEDEDWDNDGIQNSWVVITEGGIYTVYDNCLRGQLNWTSNSSNDYDQDGCMDITEDYDDDNDWYLDIHELEDCGEDNDPLDETNFPSNFDNDTLDYFIRVEISAMYPEIPWWHLNEFFSCDELDSDDDNDGWGDVDDAFPFNASEWEDFDSDGIGDNADDDDDDDGYPDIVEVECMSNWTGLPSNFRGHLNASHMPLDSDQDGICDELDSDIDGDGYENVNDTFPLDPKEWADFDIDGIGDEADEDDDNDFWNDSAEFDCNTSPLDNTSMPSDNDGDLICDFLDTDDDNDGIPDSVDSWPMDHCVSLDSDSDGLADDVIADCETLVLSDFDDDNDLVMDVDDFCSPGETGWISGAALGTDNDGDGCRDEGEDQDDDNDGYLDDEDDLPYDSHEWLDTDGDGMGNNADGDDDGDQLSDELEIHMGTNPLNPDTDSDGHYDSIDLFPTDASEWGDADGDGVGDNSDDFPSITRYQETSDLLLDAAIIVTLISASLLVLKLRFNRNHSEEE